MGDANEQLTAVNANMMMCFPGGYIKLSVFNSQKWTLCNKVNFPLHFQDQY